MYTSPVRSWIVLGVALLLSQSAAATWFSHGTFEPDNALDEGFMWTEPPGALTDRIYFNAIAGTSYGLRGALVNPNVGALGTTNEAPTLEHHMAILGVWVDCNGDGYVGLAETAQQEYPAALLGDLTICPLVTGDVNTWAPGAHNYNGWVSEYVPIAGKTTDPGDDGNDSRVYFDAEAMVWGDNGRPDTPAPPGSCSVAPMPRGTFQSTGGAVNWLDCASGLMERWNDAWYGRRLGGVDVPGLHSFGIDLGLDFEDPNNASGTWLDHPTFGTEDSEHSAVVVADCSEPNIFRAGDAINQTAPSAVAAAVPPAVHNLHVPTLDPQPGNLQDPTVPATLNRTQEDMLENCDTSDDDGHDFYGNNYVFYLGETDVNPVSAANKRSASWNLQFSDIGRDPTIVNLPANQGPTPPAPIFGGRAGMALTAPLASNWNSPSVLLKAGPRLLRTDINNGTAAINDPTNFTFYAFVGDATLERGFQIPDGRGKYGEPQCGQHQTGVHNGWNCDADTWYLNPDGSPVPEPTPLARVGQPYNLRDTDCYDGRNALGVPLGLTAYGVTPCVPYE